METIGDLLHFIAGATPTNGLFTITVSPRTGCVYAHVDLNLRDSIYHGDPIYASMEYGHDGTINGTRPTNPSEYDAALRAALTDLATEIRDGGYHTSVPVDLWG